MGEQVMEKTLEGKVAVFSGAYPGLIGWLMTDAAIEMAPWGSANSNDRKDYLRMTFLQPEDKLIEGLERMKTAMQGIVAGR